MEKRKPGPSTSKDESNNSSLSEEGQQLNIKKKKKSYTQKYQQTWEEEEQFRGWLRRSKKGPTYAYCKVCDKDLVCGKSELLKHSQYNTHRIKAKVTPQRTLTSMLGFQKNINLENQVKTAEIRFAAFVAEHNLPFNVMDHLSECIGASFPDSEIAKKFSSKRTKTTAIVNNVTGSFSFETTLKLLNTNKFSLIVDESTDTGVIKHLSLVARLCTLHVVEDIFLGLIPVPDGTADGLYRTIVDFFIKYNVDWKQNLIGFASDGASCMMGVHNSLSTKLKSHIPNLFLMKCTCHSFVLCANYACEKLPEAVELLARDIYTYFHQSYKRQNEFTQFQNFVAVKPHKMLQPSHTRWLSLHSVVKRILEQYNALLLYFTDMHLNHKVSIAESILKRLKDPSIKLYYQFLDFVLAFFKTLNLEMQSETVKIHTLYSNIESVLKSLLDCYLDRSYLEMTPLENIQYRNPHYFQPLENLYLGANIMASLANDTHHLTETEMANFRKHCLEFFIESCKQIYNRFNPKDSSMQILKKIKIISPSEVLSKKHNSIAPLAVEFPNLIKQNELNDIDVEWRLLRNVDIRDLVEMNISNFWKKISEMKTSDDTPLFPKLCKFVYYIFTLPHSSATVERIFSQVNLNKTKIRNKLSTDTLQGILHTKQLLKNKSCYNFPVDNELFKRINKSMYHST